MGVVACGVRFGRKCHGFVKGFPTGRPRLVAQDLEPEKVSSPSICCESLIGQLPFPQPKRAWGFPDHLARIGAVQG